MHLNLAMTEGLRSDHFLHIILLLRTHILLYTYPDRTGQYLLCRPSRRAK